MATERDRLRCQERIERLADSSPDPDLLRREVIEDLRRTIGFEACCWPLADPSSLLAHSGVADLVPYLPAIPRMLVLEQAGDVKTKLALAQSRRHHASSLHAATGGDLARSRWWDECLRPFGVGDQLTVACGDPQGCWGWIEASRASDQPPFQAEDLAMLEAVSATLGRAHRRSIAWSGTAKGGDPPAAGVLLIDDYMRVTSWTPSVDEWLHTFPSAELYSSAAILPAAVYSLAGRVLADSTRSASTRLPPRIRLRTITGRWATLDGGVMEGRDRGGVAITIRSATPPEVLDLLVRACALTARERQLVSLLVTGLSTRELAEQLCITPYTVKDHLKAIFNKTGVRSRRELIGEIVGPAPTDAAASELHLDLATAM
jgi:DNA-binding CsgD family transcriptional regulator